MTERQQLLNLIKGDSDMVTRMLMVAEANTKSAPICQPEDAVPLFLPLIGGRSREHFAVIALDRKNRVLSSEVLTIGNDASCIVDPRQVLSWALRQGKHGASAIVVAHNHPSGDPTPSSQDKDVTRRLVSACEVIGIRLLDHLVICSSDKWSSLCAHGCV